MSSRSAVSTSPSTKHASSMSQRDARVRAGGFERVQLAEGLALGERAASQASQQQVGASGLVDTRADVNLTGGLCRGEVMSRLGQHRHPYRERRRFELATTISRVSPRSSNAELFSVSTIILCVMSRPFP